LRYRLLDRMRGGCYPKPITREDFDKAGSILMLGASIEEFGLVGKASPELTRRVIAENDADVLAVQEAAADDSELEPLLGLPGVENVVACLPAEERWTHYYKRGKKAEQLDYMMLSPQLAATNSGTLPWIDRKGLGTDIDIYTGERYSKLSGSEGASDHCPLLVRLTVQPRT
jgi:endonuclease/exonuclease/phosphatase family metal-dependent hydrolase